MTACAAGGQQEHHTLTQTRSGGVIKTSANRRQHIFRGIRGLFLTFFVENVVDATPPAGYEAQVFVDFWWYFLVSEQFSMFFYKLFVLPEISLFVVGI